MNEMDKKTSKQQKMYDAFYSACRKDKIVANKSASTDIEKICVATCIVGNNLALVVQLTGSGEEATRTALKFLKDNLFFSDEGKLLVEDVNEIGVQLHMMMLVAAGLVSRVERFESITKS